jgi:hypothetical protein
MVNYGLENFAGQALSEAIFSRIYKELTHFHNIEQRTVITYLRSSIIHVSFPYPTLEQSMAPLLNRNPPEPQTGKRIQPFFFTEPEKWMKSCVKE